MTVDEALAFFENQPRLRRASRLHEKAGLHSAGPAGHHCRAVSGASSWRGSYRTATGQTFYILDELTVDSTWRMSSPHRGVWSMGNTVIIEHNLDVIKSADWIIDLG